MEVEEDPSSQYVDYTNATSYEQFILDIEQTLLAWQLENKGHITSPTPDGKLNEYYKLPKSMLPKLLQIQQETIISKSNKCEELNLPITWSRVISFEGLGNYTLMLFTPAVINTMKDIDINSNTVSKEWLKGMEHFTPTMLSLFNDKLDFQWKYSDFRERTIQNASKSRLESWQTALNDAYPSNPKYTKARVAQNVQKWFGINEFLLLSRTTQQPIEKSPSKVSSGGNVEGSSADSFEFTYSSVYDSHLVDVFVDEDEAGMLLSAVHIAFNNVSCTLPIFVPVFEPSRGTWSGTCQPGATGNVVLSMETAQVPELNQHGTFAYPIDSSDTAPQSANRTGSIASLLDLFHRKLQLPLAVEQASQQDTNAETDLSPGTRISVSYDYSWTRPATGDTVTDRIYTQYTKNTQVDALNILQEVFASVVNTEQSPESEQFELLDIYGEPLFGSSLTPVEKMNLSVVWRNLIEGRFVDNAVHSTLTPLSAPEWILNVGFQGPQLNALYLQHGQMLGDSSSSYLLDYSPNFPFSRIIVSLVKSYNQVQNFESVSMASLAPNVIVDRMIDYNLLRGDFKTNFRRRISRSNSSSVEMKENMIPAARAAIVLGQAIGSLTSSIANSWNSNDIDMVGWILNNMFPHTDSDECYEEKSGQYADFKSIPTPVKYSVPVGQLTSVLACKMGQLQSVNTMALLWIEFIKICREHWNALHFLPRMSVEGTESASLNQNAESTNINKKAKEKRIFEDQTSNTHPGDSKIKYSVLHQKLQQLNHCIHSQRNTISSQSPLQKANQFSEKYSESEGTGSDDEFFDTINDELDDSVSDRSMEDTQLKCLLNYTSILAPTTHFSVPVAIDSVLQEVGVASGSTTLDYGNTDSSIGKIVPNTSLPFVQEDILAFRELNKSSCFADFIRWYSPSEWIPFSIDEPSSELPEAGKNQWWFPNRGKLSERMQTDNEQNLFYKLWTTTIQHNTNNQNPEHNPVKEAELIFQYLENMSPHQIFHEIIVAAIGSSYAALCQALPVNELDLLPVVQSALALMLTQCNKAIDSLNSVYDESTNASFTIDEVNTKLQKEKDKAMLAVESAMAIDSCHKLILVMEQVENLISRAIALRQYLVPNNHDIEIFEDSWKLVNSLLSKDLAISFAEDLKNNSDIVHILDQKMLREYMLNYVFTDSNSLRQPFRREYVLRTICSRPFLDDIGPHEGYEFGVMNDMSEQEFTNADTVQSPLVVNRMYAAFEDHTVRFALALTDTEY